MLTHCFTVDVEEHFQVSAMEPYVPRGDWDRFASRVVPNTTRILEAMARRQATGTFFVLGWVAEPYGISLAGACISLGSILAALWWTRATGRFLMPIL
mgnify:CR=1 FL=1